MSSKTRTTIFPTSLRKMLPMALTLMALYALAIHTVIAHDIWWQLKTGEWILGHGFPERDPFSYGFPGQQWIELRWFYCVILFLLFQAGGLNLLILLKCVLLTLVVVLLTRMSRGHIRWLAAFAVGIFIAVAHDRFTIRPELVTFVMLAAFLSLSDNYLRTNRRRPLYLLIGLQVIWANSHTLFILGPVLLATITTGMYLGHLLPFRFLRKEGSIQQVKTLGLCTMALVAASLMTPYGAEGLAFPFRLFTQIREGNALNEIISEFVSPWRTSSIDFLFLSYVVLIPVAGITFVGIRKKLPLSRLLVWGSYVFLSCLAWRNVALFGLISAYVIIRNVSELEKRKIYVKSYQQWLPGVIMATAIAGLTSLTILAVTNVLYRITERERNFGFGLTPDMFPVGAFGFIRQHQLPTPVITSLGDGGYALFEGGPSSTYVDGRLEVYTPDQIRDAVYLLTTGDGFQQRMAELNVHTAVIRLDDQIPLLVRLLSQPDWVPVYYDRKYVVCLQMHDQGTRALGEKLRVTWNDHAYPDAFLSSPPKGPPGTAPWHWPSRPIGGADHRPYLKLGKLYLNVGNLVRAKDALTQAYDLRKTDDVLLYLGSVLEALGDEKGIAYLNELDAETLARADVNRLRADIDLHANRRDLAQQRLQEIVQTADAIKADYMRLAALSIGQDTLFAMEIIRQCTIRFPEDIQVLNQYAQLQITRGDFDAGIQTIRQSLSLRPDQADTWHFLGMIYLRKNDPAQAIQAFQSALTYAPDYAPTLEILSQLQGEPSPR